MRIIDPGHVFSLDHLDGAMSQMLTFVKRVGEKYPGNVGAHEGTTTQEVLRALICRMRYVNTQQPCAENDVIITNLVSSLWLLELRAARKRGEALAFGSLEDFEAAMPKHDGHVRDR